MDIFEHFTAEVGHAISELVADAVLPDGLDLTRISVEPPRDASHGDVTTNAAMVLAKPAGAKPRDIADALAGRLRARAFVAGVDIAGPGFINLTLTPEVWPKVVAAVLEQKQDYGRVNVGAHMPVNVEYVSANPTGPLHVGHCRGAVFGDALARLLEYAGYDVTREYYTNDAGAQVDVLARSVHLRYREVLGEDIGEIPSGLYPAPYLIPVAQQLVDIHGGALADMPEQQWLPIIRDFAIDAMMDVIRDDLKSLNIEFDVFFSERSLHGADGDVAVTIEELRGRGLVFEGRLPPPKGQVPEDWEDREQTLFRATAFGDDIDRPLIKSDGSYTYFASDVAYFHNKFERGFKQMIYVLGADHGGYVKRLKAIASAISGGDAEVVVRLCQLVKLFRGGQPVRMSKRAGTFVTLRELVDEVGPDVIRFIMLFRKNDASLEFDFEKVTEQSRENPVFYVQYAHARICSVFRNAAEIWGFGAMDDGALTKNALNLLQDEAEIAIIRRIADYPRVVQGAAVSHEPHRIAFYLYELASTFHALWNRGKESPQLRFIDEANSDCTGARLALLRAVRYVLANGLGILGVVPVEEMR
ncbi:MAG: arginine--tRNA ligase [Hyphomicrobiales bacterium]